MLRQGPGLRLKACCIFVLVLPFLTGCPGPDGSLKAGFESGLYRTVVAFGDSIVEGFGQPEGWPEMLGRDLAGRFPGIRVHNAGISGDTAGGGLSRLERDVLRLEPDLVIISFGLNDMKNHVPVEVFHRNMVKIVQGVKAAGGRPVLLTTTRLQRGTGMVTRADPGLYNEAVRALAEEQDVVLIDVFREFKGLNSPQYLMDVAHPNLEGYRRLTGIIREGLVGE